MHNNFKETQKFDQWWLWVILLIFPILSLGDYEGSGINFNYVIIGVLIPLCFYFLELRTVLDKNGFAYQFFPIHLKYYKINFDEIESIESVIYRPIGDFGGWGIRFGFKAKAYTTKGNKGVMINLKTGRKVLFGSQKSKELEKVFNYYLKNQKSTIMK